MRPMKEKTLIIEDQTFHVRKFTPEVGCYWAARLFGDLMGSASGKGFSMQNLPKIIQDFTRMPRQDFALFQRDCLSFVRVKFDSGMHDLVDPDGFLTLVDISSPAVFQLTIHSFMFSMTDFLDPSLLDGLLGAVPAAASEASKETGSEPSSSPQSA